MTATAGSLPTASRASSSDLARSPTSASAIRARPGCSGKPPFFVTVEGRGEIIRDKAQFAAHWHKELERWWPDGIDTPGLALVKVHASRLHYWDGEDEGEIVV